MFNKNKKGISPLIATVLLIAFAVALGAVVMSWGRGYVEDTAEQAESQAGSKIECSMNSDIEFFRNPSTNKKWICNSTTNYTFVIQNTGNTEFTGLRVLAIGNELQEFRFNDTINAGSPYKSSFDVGVDANVTAITINPIVTYQGDETICMSPSLRIGVDDIDDC